MPLVSSGLHRDANIYNLGVIYTIYSQRRTQDFVLGGLKENFTLTNQLGLVCICTYACNFGLYVCIICMDGSSH